MLIIDHFSSIISSALEISLREPRLSREVATQTDGYISAVTAILHSIPMYVRVKVKLKSIICSRITALFVTSNPYMLTSLFLATQTGREAIDLTKLNCYRSSVQYVVASF
jgi:hypothetical protein